MPFCTQQNCVKQRPVSAAKRNQTVRDMRLHRSSSYYLAWWSYTCKRITDFAAVQMRKSISLSLSAKNANQEIRYNHARPATVSINARYHTTSFTKLVDRFSEFEDWFLKQHCCSKSAAFVTCTAVLLTFAFVSLKTPVYRQQCPLFCYNSACFHCCSQVRACQTSPC